MSIDRERTVVAVVVAALFAAHARVVGRLKSRPAAASTEKQRLQSILRVRAVPKTTGMFAPIARARSAFSRRNRTTRQRRALVPRARRAVPMAARLPRHLLGTHVDFTHRWAHRVFPPTTTIPGTTAGCAPQVYRSGLRLHRVRIE